MPGVLSWSGQTSRVSDGRLGPHLVRRNRPGPTLLFLAFSSLRLTVASSLAIVGSLVISMPASIAPESLMPSSSSDESSPSELDEWYADGSRPVSSGAACSAALSPAPAPSFLRFCERSDLGSG